ncbi:MAG: hypothetical protein NTY19_24990 [Planctomycetota bacterium]|nr:hypothetical protein [Planctomycetota bacterium]
MKIRKLKKSRRESLRSQESRARSSKRFLGFESLEDRRLLAIDLAYGASLGGGVLYDLTLTENTVAEADTVTVSDAVAGTSLKIQLADGKTTTFADTSTDSGTNLAYFKWDGSSTWIPADNPEEANYAIVTVGVGAQIHDLTITAIQTDGCPSIVNVGFNNAYVGVTDTTTGTVSVDVGGNDSLDQVNLTSITAATSANLDVTKTTPATNAINAAGTLSGTASSSLGTVHFHGDVVLTNNLSVVGDTTFFNKLNSSASDAHTLTVTAGGGNVVFTGAVGSGSTQELGAITIVSAVDVTADSTINAARLTQTDGTGTTWLKDAVTTTDATVVTGGVVLSTDAIKLDSGLVTNGGPVTLHARSTTAAVTFPSGAWITTEGGAVEIDATGLAGIVDMGSWGKLDTTGVTSEEANGGMGGQVTVSTNGGTIAVVDIATDGGLATSPLDGTFNGGAAGNITLGGGAITLNGNLSAEGGLPCGTPPGTQGNGGTITIADAATAPFGLTLTTGDTAGTIKLNGITATGGLDVTAVTAIEAQGDLSGDYINIRGPVALKALLTVSGTNATFWNKVEGHYDLAINSLSTLFKDTVGAVDSIGDDDGPAIVFAASTQTTFSNTLTTSSSITQTNGSDGSIEFQGDVQVGVGATNVTASTFGADVVLNPTDELHLSFHSDGAVTFGSTTPLEDKLTLQNGAASIVSVGALHMNSVTVMLPSTVANYKTTLTSSDGKVTISGSVTSDGGEIEVNADTGVELDTVSSAITSFTAVGLNHHDAAGLIDINADVDANGAGSFTMSAAGSISSDAATTENRIEIDAADFVVSAGTISAGTTALSVVHIGPTNVVATSTPIAISLGVGTVADTFGVADAELDRITAARVEIGYRADVTTEHVASGAVTIDGDVNPANTGVLVISGASINDDATSDYTITVLDLALLAASGGTGVGGGNRLQVTTGTTTLVAQASAGNINILESTDVTVGTITTDEGPIEGLATTAGDITLTTTDGSITVDYAVTAGTSTASDGNVILDAQTTTAAARNVALNASVSALLDQVDIRATGSITQPSATTVYILADKLTLVAGVSIGEASGLTAIDTQVTTVAALAGASGNIFIQEAALGTTLTVDEIASKISSAAAVVGATVTSGDGGIDIRTADGTLTISKVVTASGTGNVILDAVGTSDVALGASVSAGATGDTHIKAGRAITYSAGTVGGVDVFLQAVTGVGATGAANAVQTSATNLGVSAGDKVYVTEADSVTVTTVSDLITPTTFEGIATSDDDVFLNLTAAEATLTIANPVANGANTIRLGAGDLFAAADNMVIATDGGADYAVSATVVTLRPQNAESIALGTASEAGAGVLELVTAELAEISALDLIIGDAAVTTSISLTDDTAVANVTNVLLQASVAIDSTAADHELNIKTGGAGNLAFSAGTSIGATFAFGTEVATVSADAAGGLIAITETVAGGALAVGRVTVDGTNYDDTTGTSTITIVAAGGNLTLNTLGGAVSTTGDNAKITLSSSDNSVIIRAGVTSDGGEIEVNADTGVTLDTEFSDIASFLASGLNVAGLIDINADVDAGGTGTFTMSDAGASVSSNAGTADAKIEIDAGDFVLSAGTINAGDSVVHIGPTAGNIITLGADGAGFSVNNTELNQITAGRVEIGYRADVSEHVASGAVTINANVNSTVTTVLVISSGAAINADAAGRTVTETSLAFSAVTGVGASTSFDVETTTLAAKVTGTGAIVLNELTDVAVGRVAADDGSNIDGLTTNAGDITLTTTAGSITVDYAVTAGTVAASDGNVILDAHGATKNVALNANVSALADQVDIRATVDITQPTNSVYIFADKLTLVAGGSIGAGTSPATYIDTQVTTVAALAGTAVNGNIFINEAAAGTTLTVGAITSKTSGTTTVTGAKIEGLATNGTVDSRTANGTLTISNEVTAKGTGILILAGLGGNVAVGASVSAGFSGDAHIEASGAISQTAGTVSGNDVFLEAVGSVGASISANTFGATGTSVNVSSGTVTVGWVSNLIDGGWFEGIGAGSAYLTLPINQATLTIANDATGSATVRGGVFTATADEILINTNTDYAVDVSGLVTLKPYTAESVALGANDVPANDILELNTPELAEIKALDLFIGDDTDTTSISLIADTAAADVTNVFLQASVAIGSTHVDNQLNVKGGQGNLVLRAGTSIGDTIAFGTTVATLSAQAASGVLAVADTDGLILGRVTVNSSSFDNTSATGVLTVTAGTDLTLNATGGAVSSTGVGSKITLTATAGAVTASNSVTSSGGEIEVNATAGVTLDAVNSDFTSITGGTAGLIDINADKDADGTGTFTISDADASLSSNATTNDARIEIDAGDFDLTSGLGTIDAGASEVHIGPTTAKEIKIGTGTDNFGVADVDLDKITAARVEIGYRAPTGDHVASGAVTIDGDVSPSGTSVLVISSGAAINADAAGRTVTETSLAFNAVLGVGATTSFNVETGATTLAARVTGTGAIVLNELTDVTVGTITTDEVDIVGLTTFAGNITLTTTEGSITVDQVVTAGTDGNVILDARTATTVSHDVELNASVTALDDQVDIRASGSITQPLATFYIIATDVTLVAVAGSVGGAAGVTAIDTQATNVAAAAGTNVYVNEDTVGGDLTIGTVTSLITTTAVTGVSTTAGHIDVRTENGTLTVSSAVAAGTAGNVNLVSPETAIITNHVVVNATVTAVGGTIDLSAGDNLTVGTTAHVHANGSLTLSVDAGSTDLAGGTANLYGQLASDLTTPAAIQVNGGPENDTFTVDSDGDTTGTVLNVLSKITIVGAAGIDSLTLVDSGETDPTNVTLDNVTTATGGRIGAGASDNFFIGVAGDVYLTYTGLENVTLNMGSVSDTIDLSEYYQHGATTNFTVGGGTIGAGITDTIMLNFASAAGPIVIAATQTGSARATGFGLVAWTSIEDFSHIHGLSEPVLTTGDLYVQGTTGNDVITFTEVGIDSLNAFTVKVGTTVYPSSGTYGSIGTLIAWAGAGNDRVTVTSTTVTNNNCEFHGEAGNDYLSGAGVAGAGGASNIDILDGGIGDDTIYGLNGKDILTGGAGKDLIDGGDGDDWIDGGAGADTIYTGAGNDLARGGADADVLYSQLGNDVLLGEGGNDILYGGTVRSLLIGGEGADYLYAAAGDIMIAAKTSFDDQSTAHDDALKAIVGLWKNVVDGTPPSATALAARLSILSQQDSDGHVFSVLPDDATRDYLFGSTGTKTDWFLYATTGVLDSVSRVGLEDLKN